MEFCQVQNSLCVQALSSPVLAPLLHGTQAGSGRQPYFAAWYKAAGANGTPFFFHTCVWRGGHHVVLSCRIF